MEKETKIWLGEDGIVRVKVEKDLSGAVMERVLLGFREIAKKLPPNPDICIDISAAPAMPNFIFRKKTVEIIKDTFSNPGFHKIAEWGTTNNIVKTITIFMTGSIGLRNFRYFETEEKALKWLKEK